MHPRPLLKKTFSKVEGCQHVITGRSSRELRQQKNYVRAESSGTCLFRMHNTGTIVLYHDLLGTFASFRKLGG